MFIKKLNTFFRLSCKINLWSGHRSVHIHLNRKNKNQWLDPLRRNRTWFIVICLNGNLTFFYEFKADWKIASTPFSLWVFLLHPWYHRWPFLFRKQNFFGFSFLKLHNSLCNHSCCGGVAMISQLFERNTHFRLWISKKSVLSWTNYT